MLKLHGFALSNYHNMVKLALLEKGFEFEEILARPSQDEALLEFSPMGKIPFLETREGYLSETSAVLEFLEDVSPEIPLFPADPFEKAKARELINVFELYIENALRPLYAAMFGWAELDVAQAEKIAPQVDRGLAAIKRLARFEPFLLGETLGMVDIFAYYALSLARKAAEHAYQRDILTEVAGFAEWHDLVAARTFTREVDQAAQEAWDTVITKSNN